MLKHIVVAIDGSAPSRHAARFALTLAEELNAEVTLLTVLQPPEVLPMGPMSGFAVLTPPTSAADIAKLKETLAAIAAEKSAVKAHLRVEIGPVADTICDVASKEQADLVVMGARGLGPGARFLLGSVSDRVVHHAHCPVTVWRDATTPDR